MKQASIVDLGSKVALCFTFFQSQEARTELNEINFLHLCWSSLARVPAHGADPEAANNESGSKSHKAVHLLELKEKRTEKQPCQKKKLNIISSTAP